ncbi:MAG TPA: class I SAM-dependent methyltransferase [Gemmatimonadales bacterium]|nr:class I SAM-dependent methyltransferase [Gemmatimonadales bacterium]
MSCLASFRTTLSGIVVLLAPVAAPAAAQVSRAPDVHFVPTPHEVVAAMLEVAQFRKNDVLYDLGSGDGRIVIAAAKKHGTRGTGIDLDPDRIRESRAAARKAGVTDKVRFRQADLFETDLRKASVVTLYLLPTLNVRLRPKLFEELRPGSRVVSHAFDMGDWKPDSTFMASTSAVFFWVMPANAGGEWTLTAPGGKEYTVRLRQKFQNLEGSAERNGATVPLAEARIRGDKVTLEIADASGPVRLEGRIEGDTMTGSTSGSRSKWSARRMGAAPPLETAGDG